MKFPARLHVLLASEAPYGVVIRRGPAKTVCTIGWNRAKDEFAIGQWLRSRIYEHRCDLSPRGEYLIYFTLSGRWGSETSGAYTAISRAPYLKAISLYPQGTTYGGGGLFTGRNRVFVSRCAGRPPLRESKEIVIEESCALQHSVYYTRLRRDGWSLVDYAPNRRIECVDIFEKPAGAAWILRKLAYSSWTLTPGKSFYWEEHEVVNADAGITISRPDWEWAEFEGGRVVWTTAGTLNAATLNKGGLGPERLLADFNGMQFKPIEAPY
jgi:hypothetical protein